MSSSSSITIIGSFTLFFIYIEITLSDIYHVDPLAPGQDTGLSWIDAFTTLDLALETATKEIDEIWLKGGFTYIPSNPSDRTDCFKPNRGITIFGGFDGTETDVFERAIDNPPSAISGDIGIINDINDNCYHVIQYDQKLSLDNVIIQHGYANYDGNYTTANKPNAIHRYGGALITTDVLDPALLYLNNVLFRNNTAINGGALWFAAGAATDTKVDVVIRDSKFEYNTAIDRDFEGGYGGAIYEMFLANVTLWNTEFKFNEAINRGGAIYQDYGAKLYTNGCIFESNTAGGWGGAIFSEDRNSQTAGTEPKIISSSFRFNDAGIDGGAIYFYIGVIGTLNNNIFTSNTASGLGTAVSLLGAEIISSENVFENNTLYNESAVVYTDINTSLVFDLNQELSELYTTWSANEEEWDIYPFNANDSLCYVAVGNTNDVTDGASWNTAFTEIQQCLTQLRFLGINGGEVWVKTGVYFPTIIPQWKVEFGRSTSEYNSFEMYDGIRMYGGFDGTETSRDQRNWRDNPTYLSCAPPDTRQCFQILNAADDALVDGFIFQEAGSGKGQTPGPTRRRLANSVSIEEVLASNADTMGGGLLAKGDSVHVVNSIFYKLFSNGKGGAVYCVGLDDINATNQYPTFINVAFLGNRAQLRGGAISADVYCDFVCESCKFDSNDVSAKGGAIYLDFDCDPTFIDTVFVNNYAVESGGAIGADGQSFCTFNGSNTFTSNSAEMQGGALSSGSGVSINNTQGFVFTQQAPILSNNYLSNAGGIGHKDIYGWPYSTIDLYIDIASITPTASPTDSTSSSDPTSEPTLEPTSSQEPTTPPTLLCPSPDEDTLETCSTFCSKKSTETIFIGIKDAKCPNPEFSTTTEQCITETIGCSIPWLCQILTDHDDSNTNSSCSIADILFNIHQLDCDLFGTNIQYTQFKLMQFCCNGNECAMDSNTACPYNEIYQEYSNDLYECVYSQEAVHNKWNKVTECNVSVNNNDYEDTCDYLLSQTYSKYGCGCKSSFLIGHSLDNEHYMDLIDEWNTEQVSPQIDALQLYGCASNVECVANHVNDDVFVGGLLLIHTLLYKVGTKVFVPFYLLDVNVSMVEYIEEAIQHDAEKVFVSFLDTTDEHMEGLNLKVLVIFLNVDERDLLYQEWSTNVDWFGTGSVIDSVESNNVNETLQYYGAERYYSRATRDTQTALIAVVVVSVALGVMLLVVTLICRKNEICKKT